MGDLYPMFLYGTLRPGQTLWPHIRDSVEGQARVAYAPGYRLYVSDWGTYPYMVPCQYRGPERIVRGTLVNVRWSDAVGEIVTMEVQSGYALEQVPIRLKPLGETLCLANAFVFPEKYLGRSNQLCDWQGVEGDAQAHLFDWAHHWKNHRLPGREEITSHPRIRKSLWAEET